MTARARKARGAAAGGRRGTVATAAAGGIPPAAAWPAAVGLASIAAMASLAAPPAAAAQSLGERVEAAPDGLVHFQYETRRGVCGGGREGRNVWMSGGERGRRGRWSADCDCVCRDGPAHVEMRLREGRVVDLEVWVGDDTWVGEAGDPSPDGTDLGTVPPGEAAETLLEVARTGPARAGKHAVFAATLGRGVVAWPGLLALARDREVPRDTREGAVFWLGQAAAEEATRGLESIIEDEDDLEVREHAVFALSQRDEEEAVGALIRIARTNPEPRLREKALFWLGQRGDDPRVLELFESILVRGN